MLHICIATTLPQALPRALPPSRAPIRPVSPVLGPSCSMAQMVQQHGTAEVALKAEVEDLQREVRVGLLSVSGLVEGFH